jgi:hypothetical protein
LTRTALAWIQLAVLLTLPGSASAHHSLAGFDVNRPITLKGTLDKMDWVNPHAWIHLDVKGLNGEIVSWSIQTAAPAFLFKQGIRKSDLVPGVKLDLVGYPAKDGSARAIGRILKIPDGTEFFIR